jgi:hypothetical protein
MLPSQVGFAVHPRRWVVEQFFAGDQPQWTALEGPRGDADFTPGLPLCCFRHAPRPRLGTKHMIKGQTLTRS